ncbi:uncharacterized protein B0T15DRAFT_529486 [Chaetomium strumarium]|uniref:Secreted protein n=1 Tax=Chaetomium strumarium TaxID=1170767 RepID=A0AAJ0GW37_9PEZI|nr:hypothetical protein B0T15DRAFT_529486 [Chaetomium strumarium]
MSRSLLLSLVLSMFLTYCSNAVLSVSKLIFQADDTSNQRELILRRPGRALWTLLALHPRSSFLGRVCRYREYGTVRHMKAAWLHGITTCSL